MQINANCALNITVVLGLNNKIIQVLRQVFLVPPRLVEIYW